MDPQLAVPIANTAVSRYLPNARGQPYATHASLRRVPRMRACRSSQAGALLGSVVQNSASRRAVAVRRCSSSSASAVRNASSACSSLVTLPTTVAWRVLLARCSATQAA